MIRFRSHFSLWLIIFLVVGSIFSGFYFLRDETPTWTTATVTLGDVTEAVAVSGFVEAKQIANLSFPSNGTVTGVLVTEGTRVNSGDVLATLGSAELVAERTAAVSTLAGARATYEKLSAGPRNETIVLARSTVEKATRDLDRITAEEEEKVTNAKTRLLSTGLAAIAVDTDESTTPPAVSGTYRCATEGRYTITVYGSNSQSGFSYRYEGLEGGTNDLSTDQPTRLGSCGLYLLFSPNEAYHNSTWVIDIPNQRNSQYTELFNIYTLTLTQAKNAIARAEDALAIAKNDSALTTAPARSQDLREAEARVNEATARLSALDARLVDRSIIAPFSGTITDVSVVTGETAPTTPAITLLADEAFVVKVRIPEIDIRKISVGQNVSAVFDAAQNERITGVISYVSPLATVIDGVAYFTATIDLDTIPSWLRAGLNADVDIVVAKRRDALRLPKRFINTDALGETTVLVLNGKAVATTSVEVLMSGNDGYVEVAGLPSGTTVVAP